MEKGQKFGEWTIIAPSEKPYYYTCQCSCGVVRDVRDSALRRGKSKSCGHAPREKVRENFKKYDEENIIGKKFGRLTPVERKTNGRTYFICECDCGNTATVARTRLLNRKARSCGCLKKENSKKLMDKIQEEGHKLVQENRFKGTNIYSLKNRTLNKNNSSGYKGVSKQGKGRYRAYIYLRRKQKHLGTFATAEEAYQARLEAEEEYYEPIIEEFEKKKERID